VCWWQEEEERSIAAREAERIRLVSLVIGAYSTPSAA
jgi:hypothetical protein